MPSSVDDPCWLITDWGQRLDERLAKIEDRLDRQQAESRRPLLHVYQVVYQDRMHDGGQPIKTVLIPRDLPCLPDASVPVLSQILGVLESYMSVRRRQGESMADDLIAILKRESD